MLNFVLYLLLWIGAPTTNTLEVEVCLSSEESKLYELINDYRKKKKLKPIPFSAKLSMVAQVHAKDLADHFDFSKVNECNPHSWSANGNWTSCCYTNDHKQAECMWNKPREIAGYEGDGFEIAYYSSAGANAEQGLEGWKKSPAHNPLIVNSGMWKDIEWGGVGIGLYKEYGVVWFGREVDEQNKIVQCDK